MGPDRFGAKFRALVPDSWYTRPVQDPSGLGPMRANDSERASGPWLNPPRGLYNWGAAASQIARSLVPSQTPRLGAAAPKLLRICGGLGGGSL